MNIWLVNYDFFAKAFCCEDYRKCHISSFAEYGVDMVFFEIIEWLEKSANEEENIFAIIEKSWKGFLSAEFSWEDWLKMDFCSEFFCCLVFKGTFWAKPKNLLCLVSVFWVFEKSVQKGTDRENVASCASSCHCDNFFLHQKWTD